MTRSNSGGRLLAVVTCGAIALCSFIVNADEPELTRTTALQTLRRARLKMMANETDRVTELLSRVEQYAKSKQDVMVQGWAQQLRGEFAFEMRKYREAIAAYTEAARLFQRQKQPTAAFNAYINLGRLHLLTNDRERANEHFAAARRVDGIDRNSTRLAGVTVELAESLWHAGKLAEAKEHYLSALEVFRKHQQQHPVELRRVLLGLAALELNDKQADVAEKFLAEAVRLPVASPLQEAEVRHALGLARFGHGKAGEAKKQFTAALELHARGKHSAPADEAAILNNLASLLHQQKQHAEALEHYRRAADLFAKANDRSGQAKAVYNRGVVHESAKEFSKAKAAYTSALALRRQLNDRLGAATILESIALIHHRLNQPQDAKAAQAEAELLRKTVDP